MKIKIKKFLRKFEIIKRCNLKYSWFKRRISYKFIGDEKFAKKYYKKRKNEKLNLTLPTTFDEKLWFLKLNYKNPLQTKCTDKFLVREYVKDCKLDHILNDLYGVYDNANDINFDSLPDKCFIKTNHTSGYNIVWDKKNPFNRKHFIKKFNYLLKQNYFYASREWNYKNIKPKLIVEKFLNVQNELGLVDYRFFCFNGKCEFIAVDVETCSLDGQHTGKAKRNIYDLNFNRLNYKLSREHFDDELLTKPVNLGTMIEYAERLSRPFPHVRVDFYNIDGKIIFGEMTFYHQGACNNISPIEWDLRLGSLINIDNI